MPIQLRAFTDEWRPAVAEFNQRLARGNLARQFQFPSNPAVKASQTSEDGFYEEYYLATEDQHVRGGYILKHQEFSVGSQLCPIAHYRLPLSEGIINRAYTSVGVQMVRDALAREPLSFALGMGDINNPLPRMLKALRWTLMVVPFYFRVGHSYRFLRGIRALRGTAMRRLALDIAAVTGVGTLAIRSIQALRHRRLPQESDAKVVTHFDSWADVLWEKSKRRYPMIALRNSSFLNRWYPPRQSKVLRLRIGTSSRDLGWSIVLETQMVDDRYFGNLRIGFIADCLAEPEDATAVISATAKFLENRGADLVAINHSHVAWIEGCRCSGFLRGPSNFIFAASPALAQCAMLSENVKEIYINRGDGDGPIHL